MGEQCKQSTLSGALWSSGVVRAGYAQWNPLEGTTMPHDATEPHRSREAQPHGLVANSLTRRGSPERTAACETHTNRLHSELANYGLQPMKRRNHGHKIGLKLTRHKRTPCATNTIAAEDRRQARQDRGVGETRYSYIMDQKQHAHTCQHSVWQMCWRGAGEQRRPASLVFKNNRAQIKKRKGRGAGRSAGNCGNIYKGSIRRATYRRETGVSMHL
ncbi:hypothetical protein CALVIDRAFT_362353 [Calocera viscosa TUFC12733]|uniref:Uncharacterized protein n=1 Tax=Calocera viscosa (strain TUFC12733) TaxID=1330018 RepID=A0A167H4Q8_CALVF|nr:hypothetical protein CALVIDRAFT_362353 [Calocera viscosa TUFC12733]